MDIRSATVRDIMESRMDRAVDRGCNGVEPDNVDGYVNDSGFDLTAQDQLDFNRFLAEAAHQRGLSVGLKNDVDQASALEPDFDWALNERCLEFNECTLLHPFINAGKAVFHVEYVDVEAEGPDKESAVCGQASIKDFSTLIKVWDLTAWQIVCQ